MRMLVHSACLLAVASTAVAAPQKAPALRANAEAFAQWMAAGGVPLTGNEGMHEMRSKGLRRVLRWASDRLADVEASQGVVSRVLSTVGMGIGGLRAELQALETVESEHELLRRAREVIRKVRGMAGGKLGANDYKYWGFIPDQKANVIPGGPAVQWSNTDCKDNTATAKWNDDQTEVILEIEGSHCELLSLGNFYLLGTTQGIHFATVSEEDKKHTIHWKVEDAHDPAVRYDLSTKGIRVFAFIHNELEILECVLETAELFLQPEAGRYPTYPSKAAQERNVDFLTRYAHIEPLMQKRTAPEIVAVNESLIQTGDFFGIIRLDGLDPMLGWAMGSATGHTTIAVRARNNTLYICESTTSSDYWPTNGIQCTPYPVWIRQAQKAGYNAVWAPLAPEQRAKLNVDKMWDFFYENEGLNYGFENLLWGWVDTPYNNYPCLPPDYKTCLTFNMIEVLFGTGHRLIPKVTDMLVLQAWNHRVGGSGLSPEQVFMRAETVMNITTSEMAAIVEKDEWRYNTTRYGKPAVGRSMVCCVFVCHMWKAGGLFGDMDVNCGELTNLDDYSLNIFNKGLTGENRPDICKRTDPTNQLCQLTGEYTLNLNHFNEGKVHAHMDEKCPSWNPGKGPNYWGPTKQDSTC